MRENGIQNFQPGGTRPHPTIGTSPGRDHVPGDLHVVEGLQDGGHRDHPADADEAELADRLWTEQPLPAADRDAQSDEARPDDELDDLPRSEPGDLEHFLRLRQVVHGERRTTLA
jgi:hypothetical protein